MANRNQPTYDFLTGDTDPSPRRVPQPHEALKRSTSIRPDINNESLRAQLNTLQYELDSLKQDRELHDLQHQQELRDVQSRGEADFKRAQAAETASKAAKTRADGLARDFQTTEARVTNEKEVQDKQIKKLQAENQSLREDLEDAQTELSSLDRQNRHAYSELEQRHTTLQGSVEGIQQDLEGKVAALQGTQQRLAQREREVGELENEVLRLKAQTGDVETLAIIKKELTEQVVYIKKLEGINREQSADLKQFRQTQKGLEVVEEEKRTLEARVRMMDDLRKELAEAHLQRRILEDEKQGWTSYLANEADGVAEIRYETPEQMAKAFMQERIERLSLVDRLGAVQPELNVKEENIRTLVDEKANLQAELEKMRQAGSGAANTVAGEGKARIRLERQKNLVVKEVEYLRAQMKTFEAEEAEFNPEQVDAERSKRIHELEGMVEQFRSELQTLHADLSSMEAQAPAVQSPRKRSREDDEDSDERVGELRRKTRTLQADLDSLHHRHQMLEADSKVHLSQLEKLRESSRTRTLEFRNNPTAQVEAIKMTTLRALREENAALLAQLQGRPNGTKVVPISTLENVRLQAEELQTTLAQQDKKTLRLKQIWGAKSLEFREAVASILGWKLDFMPNGRVKATSILYPTSVVDGDEEENSIVFDGEHGTMKVSGGPRSVFAGEIKGLIEFWVEGRKEIPCFLAACTLEFYDRTTRAQKM